MPHRQQSASYRDRMLHSSRRCRAIDALVAWYGDDIRYVLHSSRRCRAIDAPLPQLVPITGEAAALFKAMQSH